MLGRRCAAVATTPSTRSRLTANAPPTIRVVLASGASGVDIDEVDLPGVRRRAAAVSGARARHRARRRGRHKAGHRQGHRRERSAAERAAAKAIANSLLVKTAVHGGDPNWGRLIAAAGRAGVAFELSRAASRSAAIVLFQDGRPHDETAPEAADYLKGHETSTIEVDLGAGGAVGHDLDVRSERRVRADQRGLPDMSGDSQEHQAHATRQPATATTQSRKDFLSVLDFDPAELERCLDAGGAA